MRMSPLIVAALSSTNGPSSPPLSPPRSMSELVSPLIDRASTQDARAPRDPDLEVARGGLRASTFPAETDASVWLPDALVDARAAIDLGDGDVAGGRAVR